MQRRRLSFLWIALSTVILVDSVCCAIMVFPELDIVAVITARDFCPFGKLADDISGAVKSEMALPPDAAAANLLARAIRNVSTNRPTQFGSTQPR
jgi:hypothetical protein